MPEEKKETLFEISGQYRDSAKAAFDEELSEEQRAIAFRKLIESDGKINDKVNSYLWIIQEKVSLANARKEQAARMKALADKSKKEADRMEEYLLAKLIEMGILEVETDQFHLKVVNKGGVQPLVIIDEDKIPEEFFHYPPQLDKKKVKQRLEDEEKLMAAIDKGEVDYDELTEEYQALVDDVREGRSISQWARLEPRGKRLKY